MFLLLCFAVAPPLAGNLPSDRLAILGERRAPYRNILSAALSPDGTKVALGYPGGWMVVDSRTYKVLQEQSGPEVRWLAFDSSGRVLVFGNANQTGVQLWRSDKVSPTMKNPISVDPRRIAISADGQSIALAEPPGTEGEMLVHLYQQFGRSRAKVIRAAADGKNPFMAVSTGGRVLAVGGERLRFYGSGSTELEKLADAKRPVRGLAFSRWPDRLAVLNPDGLRIWDLSRRKVTHTFPSKDGPWEQIAWAAEGRSLAVTRKNAYEVFDLARPAGEESIRSGSILLEEPPDQIRLYRGEVIALRNRQHSFAVSSVSGNALPGPVRSLAFVSDDELWAASASGLTRWNVPHRRVEENLRPEDVSLTKAAYQIDANGRAMQYRTRRGQWAAFDLTPRRPLTAAEKDRRPQVPLPETPFCFSPDGRLIATVREGGGETRLQVRNAAGRTVNGWPIASASSAFALGTGRVAIQNGQEVRLEPLEGTARVVRIKAATNTIKLLALSRDVRLLAVVTAGEGKGLADRLEVFEIATATRRWAWSLEDGPPLSMAFDPSSVKLALGHENGNIEVFDLTGRSRRQAPEWSLADLRSPDAAVAHRSLLAAYQRPGVAVASLGRTFRVVPNKRYNAEQFVLFATPEEDHLPITRAVEILEHLGTPEARAVLTRWAAGHPEDWLTRQAIAAVRRIDP